MVERYLGKEAAEDIFCSSMLSGLMTEKEAGDLLSGMDKEAFDPKMVMSGLSSLAGVAGKGWEALLNTAKTVPHALGGLMLLGGSTGVLGSTAYDIIKERLSREDPETKYNANLEAMYDIRSKELEDAKWMKKVRSMRDELMRGWKKMAPEEYAAKYKALSDALDERRA